MRSLKRKDHEKNQQLSIMWKKLSFSSFKESLGLGQESLAEPEEDGYGTVPPTKKPSTLRALFRSKKRSQEGATGGSSGTHPLWQNPFEDLPESWDDETVPSAPVPSVGKVVLDLVSRLEILAPRQMTPRSIAEMSQNFPPVYRGDYKSRRLCFLMMGHHVTNLTPLPQELRGFRYLSEVKECILFGGSPGSLPPEEPHHFRDAYQWRFKGDIYEWSFSMEAYPTVMSGKPLHEVISTKSLPVLKALGLTTTFRKDLGVLEVTGP